MTLTGTGRLIRESDGSEVLSDVGYLLDVIEPSHGRVGRVSGRITNKGFVELTGLVMVSEPVILELEDARQWPCWVQNNSGALAARGGIS